MLYGNHNVQRSVGGGGERELVRICGVFLDIEFGGFDYSSLVLSMDVGG